MTDVVIVAIVTAVPATLGVLLGGVGAIIGRRNGRKADEIHVLVNSKMTAVKDELSIANKRIVSLEALIASLQKPAGDY